MSFKLWMQQKTVKKCQHWNSLEQRALKIVNSCLDTNIYSYLETSCGQSFNLYLNAVHFFQHQC